MIPTEQYLSNIVDVMNSIVKITVESDGYLVVTYKDIPSFTKAEYTEVTFVRELLDLIKKHVTAL